MPVPIGEYEVIVYKPTGPRSGTEEGYAVVGDFKRAIILARGVTRSRGWSSYVVSYRRGKFVTLAKFQTSPVARGDLIRGATVEYVPKGGTPYNNPRHRRRGQNTHPSSRARAEKRRRLEKKLAQIERLVSTSHYGPVRWPYSHGQTVTRNPRHRRRGRGFFIWKKMKKRKK